VTAYLTADVRPQVNGKVLSAMRYAFGGHLEKGTE